MLEMSDWMLKRGGISVKVKTIRLGVSDLLTPQNLSLSNFPVYVHIEGAVGVPLTQSYLFSIVQFEEQPSPFRVLPSSQARPKTLPSPHTSLHPPLMSSYPFMQTQVSFKSVNLRTGLQERHVEAVFPARHPSTLLQRLIRLYPLLQTQALFLSQ